jgi:hypothetical protein
LLTSFREKNIWRVNRMDNLRTESRNINKWKKKIQLERQLEEATWRPPVVMKPAKKKVAINSLEDIPSLLDSDIDPMLAISTCRNSKEVRVMQNAIKESRRPKSARAATVRKHLDGASSSIKHTGPKRSTYLAQIMTNHSENVQRQLEEVAFSPDESHERPHSANQNLPNLSSTPRDQAPTSLFLKSPSRHLVGSSYIPPAMSYCDFLPATDINQKRQRPTTSSI